MKKDGHLKVKCRKRKNDLKREARESELEGDSMPKRLDLEDNKSLLVGIDIDRANNSWFFHLDYFSHMCSSRDFFSAYINPMLLICSYGRQCKIDEHWDR